MDTPLRIHSVIPASLINGPGTRLVVFTQGCSHNCPGCFNKALHCSNAGTLISADQLMNAYLKKDITGLTVSGGEPFEQSIALFALLKTAREEYGLSVVLYTGYLYEEIKKDASKANCLPLIDVLIDGAFMEDRLEDTLLARGSKNQRFILLTDRYVQDDFIMDGKVEIIINKDGLVTATGFSDPGLRFGRAV